MQRARNRSPSAIRSCHYTAAMPPDLDLADRDPLLRVDPWSALADGRDQLMRALEGLDETTAKRSLDFPRDAHGAHWLVGDLMTHLASWDELIAETLRAVAEDGATIEVVADAADDWATWNADRVAARRASTLQARLERLDAARRELLQAAYAIDGAPFDTPVTTAWGIRETPRVLLIVQAMHDGMHAAAIAEALGITPH